MCAKCIERYLMNNGVTIAGVIETDPLTKAGCKQ